MSNMTYLEFKSNFDFGVVPKKGKKQTNFDLKWHWFWLVHHR